MTNEAFKKLIEERGRKLIAKCEPFTHPRDKDGNRIAGWFIGTADEVEGEQVFFVAPNVAGMGRLTNHSIDRNGEVNASVLVKGVPAEWNGKTRNVDLAEYHEFIVLEDWDKDYIKKAGVGKPEHA